MNAMKVMETVRSVFAPAARRLGVRGILAGSALLATGVAVVAVPHFTTVSQANVQDGVDETGSIPAPSDTDMIQTDGGLTIRIVPSYRYDAATGKMVRSSHTHMGMADTDAVFRNENAQGSPLLSLTATGPMDMETARKVCESYTRDNAGPNTYFFARTDMGHCAWSLKYGNDFNPTHIYKHGGPP